MGYSNNPALVRKARELLQPLTTGKDFVWTGVTDPRRLAYRLRECLAIARKHPEEFPQLNQFAHKYIIRTFTGSVAAIMPEEPQSMAARPTVPQAAVSQFVIDSPVSVAQVIEAWINQQPSLALLILTNCSFSNSELSELALWASRNEPAWMVLHERGERSVTLALDDPAIQTYRVAP